MFDDFLRQAQEVFRTTGITVAKAIVITIVGIIVIKFVMKMARKFYLRSSMENSVGSFVVSILTVVLYVCLFFWVCSILNISTTGIIATVSTVVLTIALSLQESLKNIASGVIIVATKPFKEGDLVEVGGVSGRILEIHMFATKMITLDNKAIMVPNGQIVNANVINYSANATRRVDVSFGVAYGSDIKKVRQVVSNVVNKHASILKSPDPIVRLFQQADSALVFTCRVWVLNDDYWDVFYDLNEQIYDALNNARISIPFPQMDVHIIDSEEPKPAKKIAEKVIEKPVEKPIEKAVEKPAEPVAQPKPIPMPEPEVVKEKPKRVYTRKAKETE